MGDVLPVECRHCGLVQTLDPAAFPRCQNCDSSDLAQVERSDPADRP